MPDSIWRQLPPFGIAVRAAPNKTIWSADCAGPGDHHHGCGAPGSGVGILSAQGMPLHGRFLYSTYKLT
jgi:hypothetical protein